MAWANTLQWWPVGIWRNANHHYLHRCRRTCLVAGGAWYAGAGAYLAGLFADLRTMLSVPYSPTMFCSSFIPGVPLSHGISDQTTSTPSALRRSSRLLWHTGRICSPAAQDLALQVLEELFSPVAAVFWLSGISSLYACRAPLLLPLRHYENFLPSISTHLAITWTVRLLRDLPAGACSIAACFLPRTPCGATDKRPRGCSPRRAGAFLRVCRVLWHYAASASSCLQRTCGTAGWAPISRCWFVLAGPCLLWRLPLRSSGRHCTSVWWRKIGKKLHISRAFWTCPLRRNYCRLALSFWATAG